MAQLLENLKKKIKDTLSSIPNLASSGSLGVGPQILASQPVQNFGKGLFSSASETMKPLSQGLVSLDPYSRNMRAQADAQLLKARQMTTAGVAKNPTPGLIRLASQQNRIPTAQSQYASTLPTNRQVIGSGVKTLGMSLSGGLGAGGLASTLGFTAPFAAHEARKTGGNFSETLGRQFGNVLPYSGIASKVTSPFISKFAPTRFLANRVGQGALNAAESVGLDVATGNKVSLGNTALAFATGAAGKPFTGSPAKSNFRMDQKTLDELVEAEQMIRFPKEYVGKTSTGAKTAKDAEKIIRERGKEIIDRIAGKHLPDKQLETIKNPLSIAKALFDLNRENKLANVSVMGIKSQNKSAQAELSEGSKLNVGKLNLTPEQQIQVSAADGITPKEVLKNKEVLAQSALAEGRNAPVTMESTKNKLAGQLVSRQKVVGLERDFTDLQRSGAAPEILQKKIEEIARQSKIARSEGTEAGRQLQARNILADAQATPMQKVFRLLDNAGVDEKQYSKAAANVDFNNANEVVNFYRTFVPPTASEWLDVVRYNSMLSSPLTHISNVASNAINSGIIAPIEKTVTGAVDWIGSSLSKTPREQFAGEGIEYAKGYYSKLGEAKDRFIQVIKGTAPIKNLDLDYIPVGTTGKLGKKLAHLQYPTRLLEGMDQFFMALTEGGERRALQYRQGKGIKVPEIETTATENASYRLFRSQLHDKRQGHVLNMVDDVTDKISQLRSSDNPVTSTIAKFTLPFVRTPMNILKQGIEYGPTGILTLPGAKNKSEQIAKMAVGTSAAVLTSMLATSGRTTWGEPTDEKKKQAFRDAGLQPYSVKIGDKWVSYTKLPPALSFPMAIVSALHDAQENKTIDQNGLDVVLSTIAKSGKFFTDQSYLKNIGDIIGIAGKDPERIASFIGNYPQQLIPWRALLSWAARITDPYQRKVNTDASFLEQETQQLLMSLPFLSQKVPTRNNEFGEPIKNDNRIYNGLSPFKATTERSERKEYYDILKQKSLMNKNKTAIETMIEQGKEVPANAFDVSAAGETVQFQGNNKLLDDAKKDALKTKIQAGMKVSGSDLENYYLGELNTLPESSGYEKSIKENKKFDVYSDVQKDEYLSPEQKKYLTEKLGISSSDSEYYEVARQETDVKYAWIKDQINDSTDIESLKEYRKTINGKSILSDAVIDEMYNDGLVSSQERKLLKSIGGDLQTKKKSGGKVSIGKAPTLNKVQIKSPAKMQGIKLSGSRSPRLKLTSSRGRTQRLKLKKLKSPKVKISKTSQKRYDIEALR